MSHLMSENRFAIVFERLEELRGQLASSGRLDEPRSDLPVLFRESEEIAELRRAVSEIETPPTVFYTST